jgi:MmyB-like transcription regulator ligand binding domain/Helix-turn-helix domain
VSTSEDIAQFLTSRRARITPEQAGLPSYGERRVPGLRLEEVAALAGVGIDYYRRLERGRVSGTPTACSRRSRGRCSSITPSAPTCSTSPARCTRRFPCVDAPSRRASARRCNGFLTRWARPALVGDWHFDLLAANRLRRALYAPMFDSPEQPANSARFTFLDPAAVGFYPDWDRVADELVAHLRSVGGQFPHDRGLSDLIGQLATRSPEFRTRWATHNVRFHRTGTKRLRHPVVRSRSSTRRCNSTPTRGSRWPSTPPSPAPPHSRRSTSSPAGAQPPTKRHRQRHRPTLTNLPRHGNSPDLCRSSAAAT